MPPGQGAYAPVGAAEPPVATGEHEREREDTDDSESEGSIAGDGKLGAGEGRLGGHTHTSAQRKSRKNRFRGLALCLAGAAVGLCGVWLQRNYALLWSAHADRALAMPAPFSEPGMLSRCPSAREPSDASTVPCWVPFYGDAGSPSDLLRSALEGTVQAQYATEASALAESVRGRTVLVIGDSNDEHLAVDFCENLGSNATSRLTEDPSSLSAYHHQDPRLCEIDHLDLTLVVVRNFGLLVEGDWWSQQFSNVLHPPYQFDTKVAAAASFLHKLGRTPDLVILNSNLWDLMWLRDTLPSKIGTVGPVLPLLYIQQHIEQAGAAIALTRQTFPGRPVMWRNLHPVVAGRPEDFWNDQRRAQILEAATQIAADNSVTLFDIAKLLQGQPTDLADPATILRDNLHMKWEPGLSIYSDVLLRAAAAAPRFAVSQEP